jgi:hypothetical protein
LREHIGRFSRNRKQMQQSELAEVQAAPPAARETVAALVSQAASK